MKVRGHHVRFAMPVIALATLFMLGAVPCDVSDAAYLAQDTDVQISSSLSRIDINSGESADVYLDVKSSLDKQLVVYVESADVPSGITVTFPDSPRILVKPNEISYCRISISADQYSDSQKADITFNMWINDPDRGVPISSNWSNLLTVNVHQTTSGGYNNKFLGVFDNNMPSVFGEAWFPALVTFLAIISFAFVLCFGVIDKIEKRLGWEK